MINISKSAQNHFISLLSKESIGTQIRIFIVNPGMHNAECGVAYCEKDEVEDSDIEIKYNDFFVYVKKSIIPFLKDAKIDLIVDKLGSHLTFQAPYATKNFMCKDTSSLQDISSLQEKIENFLNININPQLSMHGGKVNLIKIANNDTALINFSGGCNGCSMIGSTLKQIVEKKILSFFPEIKKVIDETNHFHDENSFY